MSTNISNITITCKRMLRGLLPLLRLLSNVTRGYIVNGSNVAEILLNTKMCVMSKKVPINLSNRLSKHISHLLRKKLSDPNTRQKSFWTVYKRIINSKKQTNIPPLIENDVFISDFLQKADILNDVFASQCTIEDNGSSIPTPTFKTDDSLSYFEINMNQIINIINKFSTNKSHGHDRISVAMLQLCSLQVAIPL